MRRTVIDEYRATLEELRQELRDEIRHRVDELPEELNVPGDDWQEPNESFDSELGAERSQEMMLSQVEAALGRIDRGTFGRCEDCQKDIPARRLNAVPYAARCIQCERHRSPV